MLMLDALYPAKIPLGTVFDIGAAYVDDRTSFSYATMVSRFPNVIHLRITLNPGNGDADVLDCETSTGVTPAMCPGWVMKARAAGNDPTVYCNQNNGWAAVRAAFAAAGVAEPHYWVANYSTGPAIPAGAVAHQYTDRADLGNPYDESSTVPGWPGATPQSGTSTPITTTGDLSMADATSLEAQIAALRLDLLQRIDGIPGEDPDTFSRTALVPGLGRLLASVEPTATIVQQLQAVLADQGKALVQIAAAIGKLTPSSSSDATVLASIETQLNAIAAKKYDITLNGSAA